MYAEKDSLAQSAAKAAFARIAALEDVFSNYRADSELNRLTSSVYGNVVQVSDELFILLDESRQFAEATQGLFDITLGTLTDLWRTARSTQSLPSAAAIARARNQTGWDKLVLDDKTQSVTLLAPTMRLDVGGIAKGFILDEALAVLRHYQTPQALIEAGGDIVVGDPPPGQPGWQIDIPGAPAHLDFAREAARMRNAAIATSGDTEQFVEIGGHRYSHIIDPRTGLGATTHRVATVIAPTGAVADKYATVLTLMPAEQADSLLAIAPEIKAWTRIVD